MDKFETELVRLRRLESERGEGLEGKETGLRRERGREGGDEEREGESRGSETEKKEAER